jgi:putative ABC transport system permease protein
MTGSELGMAALVVAAALVLLAAGLAAALKLGISRSVILAAGRAIAQLLLVGLVLRTVFTIADPALVAGVLALMLCVASYEVYSRQSRRFAGFWSMGIGTATTGFATLIVSALALPLLHASRWYQPDILIPLFGIVLGSVMNAVSISLNAFNGSVARERVAIEARLALGIPAVEALADVRRAAVWAGLIPIVNQMSAAGIITLPGMMTGQILAGMAPFEAAKYQIFILLLLAGGSTLGAIGAVEVALRRMTDERDRLRLDRLFDRAA